MQVPEYGRETPSTPPRLAASSPRGSADYTTGAEASDLAWLMRWSGVLVSLALVGLMGFWGWKLTLRDVSEVPVVLAIEGPMRVAPEAPGGASIPHQGLSVNAVQEARGAMPAPDSVLVREEDETLDASDVARPDAPAAQDTPDRAAATMALVDRLVADAVAEGATLETVARSPAGDLREAALRGPVVDGGLGRSLRPVVRPASFSPAPADPAAPAAAPVAPPAPGARLVQLGAFESEAIARAEWARLTSGAFAPLLAEKAPIVQQAESGGRTFFRLRTAGFADLADARRFCAALMAGRAECIPVLAR